MLAQPHSLIINHTPTTSIACVHHHYRHRIINATILPLPSSLRSGWWVHCFLFVWLLFIVSSNISISSLTERIQIQTIISRCNIQRTAAIKCNNQPTMMIDAIINLQREAILDTIINLQHSTYGSDKMQQSTYDDDRCSNQFTTRGDTRYNINLWRVVILDIGCNIQRTASSDKMQQSTYDDDDAIINLQRRWNATINLRWY